MATYVRGNVALKEDIHAKERIQEQKNTRSRREDAHTAKMNKPYVAFLAIAAVVVLFACVQYLQLQSTITARSQQITSLQRELAKEKEENTTRYNAMVSYMNLEEIRDIAMNKFGMVYAKPGQVVTYVSPDASSVTQYFGIPENGVVASSNANK